VLLAELQAQLAPQELPELEKVVTATQGVALMAIYLQLAGLMLLRYLSGNRVGATQTM
jgi:hypothetical protein